MQSLSPAGQRALAETADRHGFSSDAACCMLDAVIAGGGRMAQFDHSEFGGRGQWMEGGMTMVSDLFDDRLKGRVAGLCRDLSDLAAREPGWDGGGGFQSRGRGDAVAWPPQRPAATSADSPDTNPPLGRTAPGRSPRWWPEGLGAPSSSGTQNGMRYAFFPQQRRLAIESDGRLTVYDTQDHEISRVSQHQAARGEAIFTSQHGPVDLASLRVVSASAGDPASSGSQQPPPPSRQSAREASTHDVCVAIEQLAGLKTQGLLSEAEFTAKKTELLARI